MGCSRKGYDIFRWSRCRNIIDDIRDYIRTGDSQRLCGIKEHLLRDSFGRFVCLIIDHNYQLDVCDEDQWVCYRCSRVVNPPKWAMNRR